MTENQFIREYKRFLEDYSNPEKAKKEKAYLYSDLKHYGTTSAERKKFGRKYAKWIKRLSKNEVIKLTKTFWNQGSFEERMMGLYILTSHKEKLNLGDMRLVEKLMRESGGWVYLDSLIIPIMQHILGENPSAKKYLKSWIKDQDYWVRRSALLAQLLFFREGVGGDKDLFFDLAKSQFDESWIDGVYKDLETRKRARFFIRKAIGWVLREMSRKDPDSVVKFLNENKEKVSGLSYREGSRNLPYKFKIKLT